MVHSYVFSSRNILYLAIIVGASFIVSACDKASPPGTKPERTVQNMWVAYAKACQHQRFYNAFVAQATKERNKPLARLYRALAQSEQIRATNHAAMLKKYGMDQVQPPEMKMPVGTLQQTLRMALSSEDIQGYGMYPSMINTAMMESDSLAAREFTLAKENDVRHYQLCFDALNKPEDAANTIYAVCPNCGYVMTEAHPLECPLCNRKAVGIGSI